MSDFGLASSFLFDIEEPTSPPAEKSEICINYKPLHQNIHGLVKEINFCILVVSWGREHGDASKPHPHINNSKRCIIHKI